MSTPDGASGSAPRLTFHALAAEHGDCAVLSYGAGGEEFRLVVDAGVQATADRVRRVLDVELDAKLELLVVTHIDADHIGGVLKLLADKSIAGRFQDVWFNGRQHLDPPGAESLGVQQGRELQERLVQHGIPWNQAFDHGAVCVQAGGMPVTKTLPSGATVTVLSPRPTELAKLRILWDRATRAAEQEAQGAKGVQVAGTPPGLEVMGGAVLDIPKLAATNTALDGSATNASSISFLFEYKGKRILFGADAHPDVLIPSAKHAVGSGTASIDVFKLPHHGSSKNVTTALLKAFPASKYVVSTNGLRHGHPDDVAIARVVHYNAAAEILFNYPSEAYERWLRRSAEPDAGFAVQAGQGEDGIRIDLI